MSSSSSSSILILCILLSFHLFTNPTSAQNAAKPFRARALILPVTKDPSTRQYITTIFQRTPLRAVKVAVDVGGKSLWVACDREEYNSSTFRPALCRSPLCGLAKSTSCGNCWDGPRPGCNDNACSNVVYNTVFKSAQIGELGTDVLVLQSTDGSKPGPVVMARNFPFSCGSMFLGENLARGVKGIAGFGRSDISLPSLLSNSLKISKKFSICLSSSKGAVFLGNGPFNLLPGLTVSARLAYTPLVVNPVTTVEPAIDGFPDKKLPSTEYFVGVEAVRVGGRAVAVSPGLLKIDGKGRGGTKISTVAPYTVLHSSIYKAVAAAFAAATAKIPRAKAVAPFATCYRASGFRSTRVGPDAPAVEFVLGNNVSWTVSGANSMVYVGEKGEVACLGFVDGGKKVKTAIVIGGHQLEDVFVEFDMEKSRVGFSSTLLGSRTSCANFNFTNKP